MSDINHIILKIELFIDFNDFIHYLMIAYQFMCVCVCMCVTNNLIIVLFQCRVVLEATTFITSVETLNAT